MFRRAAWSFLAAFFVISGPAGVLRAEDEVTVDLVEGRADPTEPNIIAVRERAPDPEPTPVTVVVEEQPVDPSPSIVVIAQPVPTSSPDPTPSEGETYVGWTGFGLVFEGIELSGLDLTFDDPEVAALAPARLVPSGSWGSPVVGAVMWGFGVRPLPWLRIPELRVGVGGGSSDGPWVPLQGVDGFEARATSIVTLRAELSGGFEWRFGPFAPFVLARVGLAAYFVDIDVRHGSLGELGTENVARGVVEAGFDAGLAIHLSENVQLFGAWRGTFTGTEGQGVHVGLSVGIAED